MSKNIRIRSATEVDLDQVSRLQENLFGRKQLQAFLKDGCLLVAGKPGTPVGAAFLDLERQMIIGPAVEMAGADRRLAITLISEVEKLAIQFGILGLGANPGHQLADVFATSGYKKASVLPTRPFQNTGSYLFRSFPRRQTRYSRRISELLLELGISPDYGRTHRMPLQAESTKLKSIGTDLYDRPQSLVPKAADAWIAMGNRAEKDDIQIQAVSAYRSVDYQAGLVRRKIKKGQSTEQILRVSAAPGFSEHHTGRAIDITTPGFPVLEEEFENSPAFAWLEKHAGSFGFSLSFPRNNRHGVAYEPWHWAWRA